MSSRILYIAIQPDFCWLFVILKFYQSLSVFLCFIFLFPIVRRFHPRLQEMLCSTESRTALPSIPSRFTACLYIFGESWTFLIIDYIICWCSLSPSLRKRKERESTNVHKCRFLCVSMICACVRSVYVVCAALQLSYVFAAGSSSYLHGPDPILCYAVVPHFEVSFSECVLNSSFFHTAHLLVGRCILFRGCVG